MYYSPEGLSMTCTGLETCLVAKNASKVLSLHLKV